MRQPLVSAQGAGAVQPLLAYCPYTQFQAAASVGCPDRRLPELDRTRVAADFGPRGSHRVKVTLEPALPPLGWKTIRVLPTVDRKWTSPGSSLTWPIRVSLASAMRLPLISANTIQPWSQFVDPLHWPGVMTGQTTTSVPATAECRTASSTLAARLARTAPESAAAFACDQAGTATASKIAATAMTTKASIKVNPFTGRDIADLQVRKAAILAGLFMHSSQPIPESQVGKPRLRPHYTDSLNSAIAYSPAGR